MALNGDILKKSSWSSEFGLHYYWSANQNIDGNYSDITVSCYLWLGKYSSLDIGSRIGQLNIAGNTVDVYIPAVKNYSNNQEREVFLCSRTQRVNHDTYGNLSNVYIYCNYPIQANINGVYRHSINAGDCNTGEINPIPRASSLTSDTSFTIGNPFYIKINRASDSFKHAFALNIDGQDFKTLSNLDTESTINFTESEIDLLYQMTKNVSKLPIKLYLTTFNGVKNLGTKTYDGNVIVDYELNKPIFNDFTFEPTDEGTKELTGWTIPVSEDNKLSIKGKTKYKINCEEAVAKNHATIVSYQLELNKVKSLSSNTTIESSNEIQYDDYLTVSAIDSRGFKTTIQKQIVTQLYEEIIPKSFNVERQKYPNNSKIKVSFSGKMTKSQTLNNTAKSFYRFKDIHSDKFGEWVATDIVVNETGELSIQELLLDGFDLKTVYNFELRIEDYYKSIVLKDDVLKDEEVFSIKEDGVYTFGKKINVVEKNAITVYPGFTGTALNDTTIFPCYEIYSQAGENLTVDNGRVKIGKGINHVLVSAQVTDSSNNNKEKNLYIYKNNTQVARAFLSFSGASFQPTISIAQKIISVTEGDTISIWVYAPGTPFTGNENMTFLTVEAID